MTVKDIANLIPTTQAVGLVGHNMKMAKKKKKSTKDIVKMGMDNLVGVTLIRATSQEVGKL